MTKPRIRTLIKLFTLMLLLGLISVLGIQLLANSNSPLQAHFSAQESAQAENGWHTVLVNQNHKIPRFYKVELLELSNAQRVDARIYPALQKMFDDARLQGVYPEVVSGYRTSKTQRKLMEEKISDLKGEGYSTEDAKHEAKKWVGEPRKSEHELGLAVDIGGVQGKSTNPQVYHWLAGNA